MIFDKMQVETLAWIILFWRVSEQNEEQQQYLTVHVAVPSLGVLETSDIGKTKVWWFITAVNRSPRQVGMLLMEILVWVVSQPKPHF